MKKKKKKKEKKEKKRKKRKKKKRKKKKIANMHFYMIQKIRLVTATIVTFPLPYSQLKTKSENK